MKLHKLFLILVITGLFIGCGGGEDAAKTDSPAVVADTVISNSDVDAPSLIFPGYTQEEIQTATLMQESLTEVMERMKHGDKSGLYENEFDYLTDDVSIDDYLAYEQVKAAGPDSVVSLEVTGFEMRDDGSAIVSLIVHFEGPAGIKTDINDKIRMYQRDGVWFKPFVSKVTFQKDYDKIIRAADSAAAAEAGEN